MLNKIIRFSLSNKYLILCVFVLLTIVGIRVAKQMDIDVFPDLTAPTVVVMTDCHGMAAEEVERLVTFPIETSVNGATGVRRVRSTSSQGFSFVWVEFDWNADVLEARQIVNEKLVTISSQMPKGVAQPVLAPQSSVMGEIFMVSMQADSTSMLELRTLADWNVKPLILATEGVSQVTNIGGDYKQYQILANPQKMSYFQVSLDELAAACRSLSENSVGNVVRQYGNEFVVRGMARTNNLEEMEKTLVKQIGDKAVRIGDVAEVRVGAAPKTGVGSRNGEAAIILSISKQPHANTLEVTKKLDANLAELQKTLPPDVHLDTHIFRQSDFIESSVDNVLQALIEGAILVIIVLFLFLGNFRTTLISLLAIPLSLLGSILTLKLLGLSINTMSLGGMAIAIGSLVDDAIIDVENVYKRLQQNRQLPENERQSAFDVVFHASSEIRTSILNATFIIMVSFLPLFFLSGMEGRMLKPLGIAFLVSLFMSLVVALTLTPLLSKMLLANDKFLAKNSEKKWLVRHLTEWYHKSLVWTLNHKKIVFATVGTLLVAALGLFSQFGRSFLPEFNEGSLVLNVVTKPGTSLDESDKIGKIVEEKLLEISEITSTTRRTGRGELDEHSQMTNSSEIDVRFELADRSKAEMLAEVRHTLATIPGIAATVGQPLGHRIDHMLSGTQANIAIKLFGDDLGLLYKTGNEIKNAISDIEGVVDVNVDQQTEVPQLQIRANRDRLAAYGITLDHFNEFVTLAFGNEKLADIYEGQRKFDLVLRYNSDYTATIDGIKSALIDIGDGRKIPLEQVADIVSAAGNNIISRENVQRKLVVATNVAGRDLRGAVQEIRENIEQKISLPEGYRIEYGGQFESEESASRSLAMTSVIAICVIFLLLFREFKNLRISAIVLVNLPLALIGGVFAIWLSSNTLSIPAIIGFISLFGIATRNGILLISNYLRLEKLGFSLYETITNGSADRLNAILMTALTGALALIPMTIHSDLSGNEIQSPMAIVILGGMVTSTILNLYVVPVIYFVVHKKR